MTRTPARVAAAMAFFSPVDSELPPRLRFSATRWLPLASM